MYLEQPLECKITAHKMLDSTKYSGGKTLRFPVIREIPSIKFNKDVKKNMYEANDTVPIQIGFVKPDSDILRDLRIWVVGSSNDALMSEIYRNILRMSGVYYADPLEHFESINLIIIPDEKVDASQLELCEKFPNVPRVTADWLRKTYLWMEVMPFANAREPANPSGDI
jgi:hypothetical protein